MNSSRVFWAGLTAFLVATGVFFYQSLFFGRLPVPTDTLVGLYHPWRDAYAGQYPRGIPYKNYLITDPIRQQIPWRKLVISELQKGRLPGWNPYSQLGSSLVGNIQSGAYYPLNIVFFLFPFPLAWSVLIILQPVLAGSFMYLYLTRQKVHAASALFGALVWSFCGFAVSWMTWGTLVHVSLWLPLVLYLIDALAQNYQRRLIWLLLIFSLIMQMTAGHMQIFVYCLLLESGYFYWRLRKITDLQLKRKLLVLGIGIAGAALILTSFQWLPFLYALSSSSRLIEAGLSAKPGWFIPVTHLIQLLAPDFFGNPATLNYWGEWNYGEFASYIGIVPLVFALSVLRLLSHRQSGFWKGVLVISLLISLDTPFSRWLFQMRLPGLSVMQPTRLLVLFDLSLVFLAVRGFEDWLERDEAGPLRNALIGVGVLLALIWGYILTAHQLFILDPQIRNGLLVSQRNLVLPTGLVIAFGVILFVQWYFRRYYHQVYKWIVRKLLIVVILLVIAGDLLRFAWKFTPFTGQELFFPQTDVISFLRQQTGQFRVLAVDDQVLPPNTTAYYGIESVSGYDPVIDKRVEEFVAAYERGKPDINPPFGFNRILTPKRIDSPLLPLLNAKYILARSNLNQDFLKEVMVAGETRVYENSRYLPRFFFVDRLQSVASEQEALVGMFVSGWDPSQLVFTEKQVSLPLNPGGRELFVSGYEPSKIDINTRLEQKSFLMILVPYDRGWQATIDGIKVEIYRADFLFQGFPVDEGDHRIELIYNPYQVL